MASPESTRKVVAITGAGAMGLAVARRIADGRLVLLADFSPEALVKSSEILKAEGIDVNTHHVDVSDLESTTAFAKAAAQAGTLEAVVHTAGLSPVQATPAKILEVDLLGTAIVLEAFLQVATPNLSLVCIASLAGYRGNFSDEFERHLAKAPLDSLLDRDEIRNAGVEAYSIAKRGNHIRVQVVSKAFGEKGARINSVSPGVIQSPMVEQEVGEGPYAEEIKRLVNISGINRRGTMEEVANAVAFLVSSESSFITGTDIRVDGGATASMKWL